MGNALSGSAHEVREGLIGNGQLTGKSIRQVGEDIHLAGIEVGHGAHDIAEAMRESARVGEHVAEAHHGISRAIPIAAVYIGGAGICASLWLGTAKNTSLLRYSIAGSALYFVSSAFLLSKSLIDEGSRHSFIQQRIASIAQQPPTANLNAFNMYNAKYKNAAPHLKVASAHTV